jgi:predicted glycosyltransferase
VLDGIGLCKEDPFIVLRFVSWAASHDIGQHGIGNKMEFIRELERYGKVLISSEGKLERDLERYKVSISPEKIHDLMYHASLYIGEGATMATEAALLGTPSIYISSLARTMGNFNELEADYGLLYSYQETTEALLKAFELMRESGVKEKWQIKRKKLLDEKIDVTAFMVWIVENYPESCTSLTENPLQIDR